MNCPNCKKKMDKRGKLYYTCHPCQISVYSDEKLNDLQERIEADMALIEEMMKPPPVDWDAELDDLIKEGE